jgi:nitrate reductase alpha subunit
LSSATNGNLAQQLWEKLESRVGRPLVDLSEELHNAGFSYEDLLAAPRRTVKSPLGSDAVSQAGTYTPFADNIELGIPWRTLTGRQHFFIDHPVYLSEGEHLPAFRLDPRLGDRAAVETEMGEAGIMLRFFPLQSRWSFDSMFGDSTMIRSLSRDLGYLWLSVSDAKDLDLTDDGWAEVSNRHGAVVARVTVSTRVNKGTCRCYIPDRTLAVPKSPSRGYRRAGGHSSLDRIRAKPSLLAGGYGQICYGFDYLGPVNSKGGQFVVVSKVAEPSW